MAFAIEMDSRNDSFFRNYHRKAKTLKFNITLISDHFQFRNFHILEKRETRYLREISAQ